MCPQVYVLQKSMTERVYIDILGDYTHGRQNKKKLPEYYTSAKKRIEINK